MDKIKIKGIKMSLNGTLVEPNNTIEFKAVDREGKERCSCELKGKYIISTFPDISTRVCDAQTQEIARLAQEYPNTKFLSITTDSVKKINEWCAANGIENIDIWSDAMGEFGDVTKTLISKIKKLTRGFIIMDGNKIVDLSFKEEVSDTPDFDLVKKYL